jgi:hypothetical protein
LRGASQATWQPERRPCGSPAVGPASLQLSPSTRRPLSRPNALAGFIGKSVENGERCRSETNAEPSDRRRFGLGLARLSRILEKSATRPKIDHITDDPLLISSHNTMIYPCSLNHLLTQKASILILTLISLALTAYGACITAKAVVLTDRQAVEIGVSRWSGETFEENLRLPLVQSLLKQSRSASNGLWFIVWGSILQAVAAIWAFFVN